MNVKNLLIAKNTRLILAAILTYVGFVLMYHDRLGLGFDPRALLGNISPDIPGGICFILGVLLGGSALRSD